MSAPETVRSEEAAAVVDAVTRGLRAGVDGTGVTVNQILCGIRVGASGRAAAAVLALRGVAGEPARWPQPMRPPPPLGSPHPRGGPGSERGWVCVRVRKQVFL